jgi:CheY-like chemotaxis protein
MVKMLRVLIGEDIELKTDLSDQTGRVQVDPGQLEQVVMNLVVNARDAMPGGGKLTVKTEPAHLNEAYAISNPGARAGNYVLIAVTDNGIGMDKETMAHIFEPFFTTKEQGKGTGLGLATVYGIVEQSRGHIAVDSEIGVGTTFKVYLPALSTAASDTLAQKSALALKGTGTILLVEDEPALRLLTAASLRGFGYTVIEAENGADALVVAEAHVGKIDIVVTDIVMPQMGGPELVSRLRAKRSDFVAILVSGYSQAAAFDQAQLGAGAILLHKPFAIETLAAKIQESLNKASEKSSAAGAR